MRRGEGAHEGGGGGEGRGGKGGGTVIEHSEYSDEEDYKGLYRRNTYQETYVCVCV